MGTKEKDSSLISEREILLERIKKGKELNTDIKIIEGTIPNTVSEDILGSFCPSTARRAVSTDMDLLSAFQEKKLEIPSFLEAGPRGKLRYDPQNVRVAIVTTGGLAPGLHSVIHSIVKRHCDTYSINKTNKINKTGGNVFGVYDSFWGLCHLTKKNLVALNPNITEEWLDDGGSRLGMVRYFGDEKMNEADALSKMVEKITDNLEKHHIDILYIIGGDGSLRVAHQIALANPTRSIVGIPKTMDNDVLWVNPSFGLDTAVAQATKVINTLHTEAYSTRRICLIELFGAESGFVAANAALASGHVNLVLIPEVFSRMKKADQARAYIQAKAYIDEVVKHIEQIVEKNHPTDHAVVVVAEGVEKILKDKELQVLRPEDRFINWFSQIIGERIREKRTREKRIRDADRSIIFTNEPRHNIRAVPANANDQIYCEQLGALAVDNALAGYTDFMISQWLNEFVLVPLDLVVAGKKGIPIHGLLWKQVLSNTRQPLSPAEREGHAAG
jgi:6-phosphofructokinase 1